MQQTLVRRDPLDLFVPMERLINRVFTDTPLPEIPSVEEALALDISETPEDLVVRASLPGFNKDDLTVEVHDGMLTINAKHDETVEEKDERFYRRERRVGSVSRTIALPTAVAEDNATAELDNGVLTLHLPKLRKDSPKRIAVK